MPCLFIRYQYKNHNLISTGGPVQTKYPSAKRLVSIAVSTIMIFLKLLAFEHSSLKSKSNQNFPYITCHQFGYSITLLQNKKIIALQFINSR